MAGNAIDILINIKETGTAALSSLQSGLSKINQASSTYQQTLNGLNQKANEFTANIKRLVLAFGGLKLGTDLVQTAASFEKTKLMLQGLTGSAEEAEKSFKWIRDFAAKTPFDTDTVGRAFTKLKSTGIDPTTGSMQTLVDAVSAFGGTSSELDRAVVAITQMSGKGVISMEELRQQLSEVIPSASKVMARELNLSTSELFSKIESGSLDATTGLKALFTGLERDYKGSAQRMMSGWNGLVSQMKTSWQNLENELMQAGLFDALKQALQSVIDSLKSGAFIEAAKSIGTALATVVKDLVNFASSIGSVIKELGPLGSILVSSLPLIIEWAIAWKALKIAFTMLIGLPLSLYKEITALTAGFTVLTGAGVTSWLSSVSAGLTAGIGTLTAFQAAVISLGSAIVLYFAFDRIKAFIDTFKEFRTAQQDLDTVAAKYAQAAKEFERYKDAQLLGTEEIKAMGKQQQLSYVQMLEGAIQYYTKLKTQYTELAEKKNWLGMSTAEAERAQKELKAVNATLAILFEQLHDTAEAAGESGLKLGTMDQNAKQLADTIGVSGINSFKDLNKAIADGKVVYDQWSQSFKVVSAEIPKSAQLSKEAFEALGKELTGMQERYKALDKEIQASTDLAVAGAKSRQTSEENAIKAELLAYRNMLDQRLAAASAEAAKEVNVYKELYSTGQINEKQFTDFAKKSAEDLKNARINALTDWQSKLKSAYDDALAKEKAYADKVVSSQTKLRDLKEKHSTDIRELLRTGMSEEEANEDRRKEATENLAKAQRLLYSNNIEDIQKSEQYAAKAAEQYASLAKTMKSGEEGTEGQIEGMQELIELIKKANAVEEQGVAREESLYAVKQKEAEEMAKGAKTAWEQSAKEIRQINEQTATDALAQLASIALKADEIAKTPIEPKVEFKPDTTDVEQAIKTISKEITVKVRYITVGGTAGGSTGTGTSGGAEGIMEEIDTSDLWGGYRWGGAVRRFAQGGWNLLQGLLPGWGGGDRVRALLEPGEFIIRKEAVAHWGAGLFEALNGLRAGLPQLAANLMPNLPRLGYATGGPVETHILELRAGGAAVPFEVVASGGQLRHSLKGLERELEKMRLSKGR